MENEPEVQEPEVQIVLSASADQNDVRHVFWELKESYRVPCRPTTDSAAWERGCPVLYFVGLRGIFPGETGAVPDEAIIVVLRHGDVSSLTPHMWKRHTVIELDDAAKNPMKRLANLLRLRLGSPQES